MLSLLSSILLLPTLSLAAQLTFQITPTDFLPNPSALRYSTTATLFNLNHTLDQPITKWNTFSFPVVPPGSYLLTVACRDITFPPHRVDVIERSRETGEKHMGRDVLEDVAVYGTFWGNAWGNKGETKVSKTVARRDGKHEEVTCEIRPEGVKEYYAQRQGFSLFSLLKSPMILMAIVSLGMIVGVPYLIDSMDEETKAEFEEMQKQKAESTGGATNEMRDAINNFDLASWMAGKSSGGSSGNSGGKS